MVAVSSPHLVDHAIGRVFESLGTFDITRVRNILKVVKEDIGEDMPASWVLRRCGSNATLLPMYAHLSLGELWKVIDENEKDEQKSLIKRFSSVAASLHA